LSQWIPPMQWVYPNKNEKKKKSLKMPHSVLHGDCQIEKKATTSCFIQCEYCMKYCMNIGHLGKISSDSNIHKKPNSAVSWTLAAQRCVR
jgi:hypothetical protein